MENKLYSHNYEWADNLRALATISVILLHVSGYLLPLYGSISAKLWWVGNIYNSSVRSCVTIFFMLTGSLLLSKDYGLKEFLKKRFLRIIPPFIFWSFVYILVHICINIYQGKSLMFFDIIKLIIIKLLKGGEYHLWFIYTLIGIYLIIPMLRKWMKNSSNSEILFFLGIWCFTILLGIPFISNYKPNFELIYFSGYIGYVILGYFLSNNDVLANKKYFPPLLIITGVLITILGTYISTLKKGEYNNNYFYGSLTPNVLISSIGIFLFIKKLTIRNIYLKKSIHFISKNSYGIYLVHILILMVMSKVGIKATLLNPVISIPLITLICTFLSAILINFLSKLKYGNYITG